jgi:isopenicillin N synthase-like dioxygenase
MADMADMANMELVPTVDVSDPSTASLRALDAACRDHGFFLLSGHGLDDLIRHTWRETERFFDADRSVHLSIMRDRDNPLGYYDRELTKRKRDHKQVFDFVDPASAPHDARNRWPAAADLPGFRESMAALYDAFDDLASKALSIIHSLLELGPESSRQVVGDRRGSMMRLNHYTVGDPVPEDERDGLAELGDTALGFHTDPGVLTVLLQDGTGGLQAESAEHGWIDVPPAPGTIVLNLGDCMQAWTNDRYRAAVHRVLPMTTSRRFSIPYFLNPPRDSTIAPVPELCADGVRYRPFAWREFMDARAYDNFVDTGAEDAQVTDFRVTA